MGRKEKKKKRQSDFCQGRIQLDGERLVTEAVCCPVEPPIRGVSEAVRKKKRKRKKDVNTSSHTLYRQTDGWRDRVTPDVQKPLSRREDDGGLDASMWQCIKNWLSECK